MKIINKVKNTVSSQVEAREERIRQKEELKRKKQKQQRLTMICSMAVLVIMMFAALGISSAKKNSQKDEQVPAVSGVEETIKKDAVETEVINETDTPPSSTSAEVSNDSVAETKTGRGAYNFTAYYEEKYSTKRSRITTTYFFDLENGVKVSYEHGKDHGKSKKYFYVTTFVQGDDQKCWAFGEDGEPFNEYYIFSESGFSYYKEDGTLIKAHTLSPLDDSDIRSLETSGFFDEYPTPADLN